MRCGGTKTDHRLVSSRERILDSVAEAMAELHAFQFGKIGALQYQQEVSNLDEPEIGGIGPYNVVDEVAALAALNGDDAGVVHFLKLWPFRSSREFFEASLDRQKTPQHEFSKGIHVLLQMMIRSFHGHWPHPPPRKRPLFLRTLTSTARIFSLRRTAHRRRCSTGMSFTLSSAVSDINATRVGSRGTEIRRCAVMGAMTISRRTRWRNWTNSASGT